ncbi:hypothetical protein GCM10008960_24110 [Deinococcus sedimenti]|uniref:Uncharacterized protein n=1 Tax=Deinococcus sedimenti TaxID=1867090 RepID=A0ABQ2S8F9_9DEIO|nr:hypothetical protein GCM10008960_24110 [Deinococcus sedimenti]
MRPCSRPGAARHPAGPVVRVKRSAEASRVFVLRVRFEDGGGPAGQFRAALHEGGAR